MTSSTTAATKKTFKNFLESTPPEVYEDVEGLFNYEVTLNGSRCTVAQPEPLLYCDSEECKGPRFYRQTETEWATKGWSRYFIKYVCRNCGKSLKIYALALFKEGESSTNGRAYKFGEAPTFGPPTPSRVISLVGPDKDFFLLGRRAEFHGLGIGAFAYYRRVVENQKSRIIREIAKVAQKLGAAPEILKDFEKAAAETQFKTDIDDIKDGLHSVLLIDNHNPLTLLHTALSEGLHAQDDKSCLELAQSIRIVLTDLADRISSVLREQQELKSAVAKLLNRKAPPAQGTSGDV